MQNIKANMKILNSNLYKTTGIQLLKFYQSHHDDSNITKNFVMILPWAMPAQKFSCSVDEHVALETSHPRLCSPHAPLLFIPTVRCHNG